MALAGMVTRNAALRNWGIGVSFAVLPPAIGAAILRYRLYDLDRILSLVAVRAGWAVGPSTRPPVSAPSDA